jgi:hypothetical protein
MKISLLGLCVPVSRTGFRGVSVKPGLAQSFPPATMGEGGRKQVKRRRHSPEQTIRNLRMAEQVPSEGRRQAKQ